MKQARPDLLNVPIIQYFGLRRDPFSDNLKASELCELPSIREVATTVEMVSQNHYHFAFTGPTGSGKSTILRYVCDRQERLGDRVLMLNGGSWGFGEFLRQVMEPLGIDYRAYHPSTMIRLIQTQMMKSAEEGKKMVIAIDEADKLRNEVFFQLHLLTCMPDRGEALASLLLSGQDGLADKLVNPLAAPLKSRMYPGHYIAPINRQMYRDYVHHHMKLCGLRDDCIDELALEHIWKATSGNLRSIGMTFRIALQYAANHELHKIDAACSKAAFADWWGSAVISDHYADAMDAPNV
jgi:type II secretory pathway predicted ATPase ExeA